MVACSILNCKNSTNTVGRQKGDISFHKFPKDPKIKEKWIDATGNKNWFPTKFSKICSIHFDDSCFTLAKNYRRLESTAYPTISVLMSKSQIRQKDLRTFKTETSMETSNENSNDSSGNTSNGNNIFIKPEPIEEHYLDDDVTLDDVKIKLEDISVPSPLDESKNVPMPVFKQCTRQILPKINMFSILEYLVQNDSFKQIHYKYLKTYIDINAEDTIGFVQMHTIEDRVTLQGTVAFDRDTANVCIVNYDTDAHNICYTNCQCQRPACCHVLAFLMWLHRRSEEQLDNNMSYYIEPLVQQTTVLEAKDIRYDSDTEFSEDLDPPEDLCSQVDLDLQAPINREDILQKFVNKCKEMKLYNSPLYRLVNGNELLELSLLHMIASWRNEVTAPAPAAERARHFLHYCTDRMAERKASLAELATTEDSTILQELQYGRVEAKRLFDICLLPSEQGSSVESERKEHIEAILNPDIIYDDDKYKENIRKTFEDQLSIKINRCGIILSDEYPMLCALPYGFTDTHIVVIVCLENEDQITEYLESNVIKPPTQLRLQLSMLLAKKEKAYFFIGFKEESQNESQQTLIHEVKFRTKYCNSALKKGVKFWEDHVFDQINSVYDE